MSTSPSSSSAARLGRIGVWSGDLRSSDHGAVRDAAAEIDALGYGAIWIPGGFSDVLGDVDRLLDATGRITVATGIINIWKQDAAQVGAWWRGQSPERQARLMLGVGVSHGPAIGADYKHPLAKMRGYLDELDAEGVDAAHRCLAALGPKMLDLSRDRSAGAHPYLTTPQHTAEARERLGAGPLLAPEQGVILETDPAAAYEIGAKGLKIYMGLPNYVNNWRRLGFDEADVTEPSHRLLDALFARGGPEAAAERVQAHLDAGADHVCVQVIRGGRTDPSDLGAVRAAWRTLADTLL